MRVTIRTGARLHFGFYSLLPIRRMWGGVGLAVDGVGYEIIVEEGGDGVEVEGCQAPRIHRFAREALERLRVRLGVRIEARRCIPEHRGLGSTTQAKLAVYTGIARIAGIDVDVYRLAELAGRGSVSGVGVAAFAHGGFVIDSGRRVGGGGGVPKPMVRLDFPEEWGVIYVTPLSGWRVREEGEQVYQGSIPAEEHCEILDTVFNWLAPAVVEKDFDSFTAALEKLDEHMGRYFSRVQGGRFCCREAEVAAKALRDSGALGVGQSSWGPTVYGFTATVEEARAVLNEALKRLEDMGVRLEAYGVIRARNRGAEVRVE